MNSAAYIVVDLDGTLCNCDHRLHLAQAKEWEEFHSLCPHDSVYPDVAILVRAMSRAGYGAIVVTGRSENYRTLTMNWLRDNGLDEFVDALLMRPEGDWRSDKVLKPELLEGFFDGAKDRVLKRVAFVVDDREVAVEGWRNYGLHCWQVRPGGF